FSGSLDLEDNGEVYAQASKNDFAVLWFASRLEQARSEVDRLLADFKLSEALKTIYSLIWDDFCSWYLEWVKPAHERPIDPGIYRHTISFFTELMQMLHPFMPFITEEIYHLLDERKDDLAVKQGRASKKPDEAILASGALLKEVITGLRDARNRNKLKLKDEIKLYVMTASTDMYTSVYHILAKQVNANAIAFNSEALGHSISLVIGKDKFFIETAEAIDTASQKEELQKELTHLQEFLLSVEKKLGNERFMQSAKPEVVALEQRKKSDAETKIKVIRESLKDLG
ncbi:MAG: class I tRNA ligase family protein, partial [Flavitalea sp.]